MSSPEPFSHLIVFTCWSRGQGCISIWSEDGGEGVYYSSSRKLIDYSSEPRSWQHKLGPDLGSGENICSTNISFGNIESRTRTWGGARDGFHMSNPHPPNWFEVDDVECRFCTSNCSLPNHFRTPDVVSLSHVKSPPPQIGSQ